MFFFPILLKNVGIFKHLKHPSIDFIQKALRHNIMFHWGGKKHLHDTLI